MKPNEPLRTTDHTPATRVALPTHPAEKVSTTPAFSDPEVARSQAHFALAPGKYRIEVRYSSGTTKVHDITVGAEAVRAVIRQQ